jgi:Cdc6-like AAA superfamily ATPase
MIKPASPFNPNQPIDPDYFEGRMDEVKKAISALIQTRSSKTQHLLITGERGIGKTSLAMYTRHVAVKPNDILKTDFKFATAYYTVERGQTLTDVCQGLTSKLLENIDRGVTQKCFEKLKTLKLHFGVRVPGIGEISVEPGQEKQAQKRLYGDFERAAREAWDAS